MSALVHQIQLIGCIDQLLGSPTREQEPFEMGPRSHCCLNFRPSPVAGGFRKDTGRRSYDP